VIDEFLGARRKWLPTALNAPPVEAFSLIPHFLLALQQARAKVSLFVLLQVSDPSAPIRLQGSKARERVMVNDLPLYRLGQHRLQPLKISVDGHGRIAGFNASPAPLFDLPSSDI
jgi:hypothetical protein